MSMLLALLLIQQTAALPARFGTKDVTVISIDRRLEIDDQKIYPLADSRPTRDGTLW